MAAANKMKNFSQRSSWIRKMFEEGSRMKAKFGADNVFDFSLGNPDLPPPEKFQEVLRNLAEHDALGVHKYMPNGGFPFVREKVAEQVSLEQGVRVSQNELLMTCGAAGAINVALKAILDPGDEVIVLAPYFVEYNFYIDNQGGVSKIVETDEQFNLDCSAIKEALTPKTKALIINSPNNPTGQIYSEQSLAELAEVLTEAGKKFGTAIHLISDEPYRKIVFDDCSVPSIFKAYTNSIIVTSYSKDLSLPGERIGFLVVHPEIDDKIALLEALTLANRILGFVNAPAFMQRIVAELQGETVRTDIYTRRRDMLCALLSDAGCRFQPPKGAFYIFPEAPIEDDVAFVALLQEQHILAVPGRGFGRPGYFRLAFCVEDEVIAKSAEPFKRAFSAAMK
jgi:aspartate aminotransferase